MNDQRWCVSTRTDHSIRETTVIVTTDVYADYIRWLKQHEQDLCAYQCFQSVVSGTEFVFRGEFETREAALKYASQLAESSDAYIECPPPAGRERAAR